MFLSLQEKILKINIIDLLIYRINFRGAPGRIWGDSKVAFKMLT
jgi:hypothetical protein